MKADCANCKIHACYTKGTNCTGIDRETILEAYSEDERRMMKAAAYVEGTFYSNITRLQGSHLFPLLEAEFGDHGGRGSVTPRSAGLI